MSNLESSPADKTAIKEAINCNNGNATKDKPNAIKRSFSTPQSPLKIEQQKRGGTIATNVSISFITEKYSNFKFGPYSNVKNNSSPFFIFQPNTSPTKSFEQSSNIGECGAPPPAKRGCFSSLDPGSISLDPNKYDKPFPYFRRPKVIGSFSLDAKRKFHNDRSQLKFFEEKKLKDPKSFSNAYKR